MATYNLNIRASWTPGTDSLGSIITKSSPLTSAEHDETHKYLYTQFVNQIFSDHADFQVSGALASKDLLIYSGTKWRNYPMSGDATMTSGGVITVAKVNGQTMSFSAGFATSGGHSITLTTTNTTSIILPTSGTLLTNDLTSGYMYMGSALNVATGYAVDATGDVTASLVAGQIKYVIGTGVITNTNIAASAGIVWTKLATGTASRAMVTDGSGYPSVSTITSAQLAFLGTTAGTLTASKAVVVDGSSKIDVWNVDNITINGNTISSTDTNGNINLTPNGIGSVVIDTGLCSTNFDLDGYDLIIDAAAACYLHSPSADTVSLILNNAGTFGISINGSLQVKFEDGVFYPQTTNDVSLGKSGNDFSSLWIRTISSGSDITIDPLLNGLILGSAGSTVGFFGSAGTALSTGWSVTNLAAPLKSLNCDGSATLQNVTDVLGTVLTELIAKNLISA